ncbi:hypothetical protein [Sphaerisporangium dianthi]|uniref:Uncharacterized protein n=1 Tax=Sphaerisporangium dianthi TaxID=1436120 RepID=A0ABV9CTH4_9ACTN
MEPYRRDTAHDPDTDRPEDGHTSDSAADDIRTVHDPSRPWAGNEGLDAEGDVRRTDENDELAKRNEGDGLDGLDQGHAVDRGSGDLDGVDRTQTLGRASGDVDDLADDRLVAASSSTTENPDPAHDSRELGDATDDAPAPGTAFDPEPVLSEGRAPGDRDLMVYPDDADYPTREQDSDLVAVPVVKPEPVAARNDLERPSEETGTGVVAGGTQGAFGPGEFEQRWREVQASFVDDPRDAVTRADQLVDEAVAAIASRKQSLVDQWKNSDQNDTERLRLALRDYRSLLQDLVGLSYSGAGHGNGPAETK